MALLSSLANTTIRDLTDDDDPQVDIGVLSWDTQVFRAWHIMNLIHLVPDIVSALSCADMDVHRIVGLEKKPAAEIDQVIRDLLHIGAGPLKKLHTSAIFEAAGVGGAK